MLPRALVSLKGYSRFKVRHGTKKEPYHPVVFQARKNCVLFKPSDSALSELCCHGGMVAKHQLLVKREIEVWHFLLIFQLLKSMLFPG